MLVIERDVTADGVTEVVASPSVENGRAGT